MLRVVFEFSPSWTRGELTPAAEYLIIKPRLARDAHLFDRDELARLLADLESGLVEARLHEGGITFTRAPECMSEKHAIGRPRFG